MTVPKLNFKKLRFFLTISLSIVIIIFLGQIAPPLSPLPQIEGISVASKLLPIIGGAEVNALASSPYQDISGNVAISGNVGIGTASPLRNLEVMGLNNQANIFRVGEGNESHIEIDGDTNTTLLASHTSYKVGIGVANPTEKLEIAGNIRITGKIKVDSTLTGFYLGGICTTDTWARLTQSPTGCAVSDYHGLAVGPLYANGAARYDLSEVTPSKEEDKLEQGDVVIIDKEGSTKVTRSTKPYDTTVYGIVSSYEQASMVIGGDTSPESAKTTKNRTPVALVGRVKAKVSTENGPIKAGDALTTSNTPGYLMRCEDRTKCIGAVAGKALESFSSGKGNILVLVTLQ